MLLALLLILAGLAGAIAPQTAAAKENYYIRVGGVEITSENYTDISASGGFKAVKSGTVTFDPATYTLTLNNATIEGNIYSMLESTSFTIVLHGKNTIKDKLQSIVFASSLRITGGGSLDIVSSNLAISAFDDLTIDGCNIDANRYITVKGRLAIINSRVVVQNNWSTDFAYKVSGGITLSNSTIIAPEGGQVKQIKTLEGMIYTVVDKSGEIAPSVVIAPGTPRPDKIFFTLSPKELDVDANRNDVSFTLSCNVPYRLEKLDKPDWLDVNGNSSDYKDIQEMTIVVKPNTGGKREGVITFKTTEGDVTLKVTQAAAGTKPEAKFTLEPKELNVGSMRDDYKVTLSCNVPYHINYLNKPDWLDVSGNSPELEAIQKITITVKPNTGGKREDVITIKTTEGDVTLKVTQEAAGAKPEPEKAVFTLEPKELKVETGGGKKEVTLSCNVPYHIDDLNKPDWLSVSGNSPGLEAIQKITITINDNTGSKREGVITFKTSEGDVTLKVTQEGKKEKPTLTLSISFKGDASAIPAGGGKKEVTVTSNGEWSASLPKDCKWLTLDKDGGTNDGTLTLTAKENTAYEPRKVTLTVSLGEGNITRTLEVTQDAKSKPALELEQENSISGSLGSPREVKIRSNVAWKATPTVAWLHVEPSEGTGSVPETLTITADPNESEKGRTGTITIESTDGSKLTRTLTVAQKPVAVAATGISLNPASITMGSGGGMVGFNVYASKGWTISGSPDWMHPDATRGSGTRLVIVRFDRNESGAERTGKLTVKSDDGKAEKVFTLTQRASQRKPSRPSDDGTYDYDLALNPEEITVGPSEGAGSSISVATSRLWAGSTTEDWIRLESAVGRGNGSFTFSLAANPSKEMRHGTITVRTQQGMDELKVAIHQQGRVGDEEAPTRVKVSSVSLDPSSITVNGDIRSKLIGASVYPSNAANKGLLWMSSNPSVATVHVADTRAGLRSGSLRADEAEHTADDYALVTIVGKGKATIAATASDGSGIVARCEVNVLSTVANTVPYAPQAKVYTVGPTLYLSLPTPETVQVYTLAGTLYRTWQAPAGDTSLTLPLGTYIIKVGQLTEKVVVR